jgi:hypothetical protein
MCPKEPILRKLFQWMTGTISRTFEVNLGKGLLFLAQKVTEGSAALTR